MNTLTKEEVRILHNLVEEVADQFDFEYQEESYQLKMNSLQKKLQEIYTEMELEINRRLV